MAAQEEGLDLLAGALEKGAGFFLVQVSPPEASGPCSEHQQTKKAAV